MPKNEFICDCNVVHQSLVDEAKKGLPCEGVLRALSRFYKIIGDETRCRIIFALKERELCVCDLANVLSMSKSSVSHQLAKMLKAGVVKRRREGKEVYYGLDDMHVVEIMQTSLCHVKHKEEEK